MIAVDVWRILGSHVQESGLIPVSAGQVVMSGGIGELYRERVASGAIRPSAVQEAIVARLGALSQALERGPVFSAWRHFLALTGMVECPRGLYIHGAVGCGKTMLMDMFFSTVRVDGKKRIHFHAFMIDVHGRLHRLQASGDVQDPVSFLAREIAGDIKVLCLDEVHVTDIADAMVLGRLLTSLLDLGVVLVLTSNHRPTDLYRGGLNRDGFLPFVDFVQSKLDVVELDTGVDYRTQGVADSGHYVYPLTEMSGGRMTRIWERETGGAPLKPAVFSHEGRSFTAEGVSGPVIFFGFWELCMEPRGAGDYLWLAERFHTLFLSEVPLFTEFRHNECRRFVHLVDILYDHRIRLFMSAEDHPILLCKEDRCVAAFHRTVSRLVEMDTEAYDDESHRAWSAKGLWG